MTRRLVVGIIWLALFGWMGTVLADQAANKAKEEKAKQEQQEYYELYKSFADAVDQVERNYVKGVNRRELFEAAIRGMLSKLDPHSNYISPEDIDRFKTSVESQFGGIGIQVGMEGGQLKVISPLVGTPAYKAGVQAGDRILEIDGKSTEGITNLEDAVVKLKGEAGTSVMLTILHLGSRTPEKVTITREVVHVQTVLGDRRKADDSWDFMLDVEKRIGYIRVTGFSRDTAHDLEMAIKELENQKVRGLILDLRFNPGGLLTSAIEIADLFVTEGRIVSTAGRNSVERTWDARKPGTYEGFPMAILVNRYSASASEIVSACLQDHKRAVIVGERTYGKGSVQNVVELENGKSAMKLTTAGYLRPSGKNIDREVAKDQGSEEWGVRPDEGFEVRLGDGEMTRLYRERQRRDIVQSHKSGDEKPEEKPAEKPDGKEAVDRQLNKALEYLTGQLALKG
jgi:carboxyl-terminal processing protease